MTTNTQISSRLMVTLFLVIGLVTANCSDTNLSPESNTITETAVSDVKAKKGGVPAGFIPNSQRYADNSMPSATGSDAGVTLIARALIDVDGNTDLEITTGNLDSDETAPGMLTKVQVKALNETTPDKDNPDWVENFNKLRDSGTFSTSYTNLVRGQQLALHTNAKGIKQNNKKATAVIFLDEVVKARPDIQVTEVGAAEEVLVDEEVVITADIKENNGDVGANTTCVLFIDGNEVDRANNIWVDAGDIVSCQFTTSFAEAGEKNIVVEAVDVVPGDFDYSNNMAYTTINVVEPQTGGPNSFYWSGGTFMSHSSYSETIYNNGDFQINENTSAYLYFSGYKDSQPIFTIPSSVRFSISSGESLIEMEAPLEESYYSNFARTYVEIPQWYRQEMGYWFHFNISHDISYNRVYFNLNINTRKYIYYGYNEYQGEYYYENIYGPGFDIGEEISFETHFGEHSASGTVPVNINHYEGTYQSRGSTVNYSNKSFYGWGSGQPEVGAESEDEEEENDEEEEY